MALSPPSSAESPFQNGARQAATANALLDKPHEANELLVQFSPAADPSARSLVAGSVGGSVQDEHFTPAMQAAGHGPLARVTVGNGLSLEQAIDILSRRPDVEFAEPNWLVSADQTSNDPMLTDGSLWGMGSDADTLPSVYGSQASEAWARGYIGSSKVAVGVIDSGFDYRHPDLYLNIGINQGEIPASIQKAIVDTDLDSVITFRDLNHTTNAGLVKDNNGNRYIDAGDLLADRSWADRKDDDGNGYRDDLVGWDFANNDNNPFDDNNHGTHVSGTIGATGGNAMGVAGVNWNVDLFGLKFLSSSGSGSTFNSVKAIDYFTGLKGSAANQALDFVATNNSWGGGGFSQAVLDAIDRAANADLLFVAAAGNGGSDRIGDDTDGTPNYPSNYDTSYNGGLDAVISVAAIDRNGGLASFSNYGDVSVDLGAPGVTIWSTLPNNSYGSYNGTSMAAPHVTGALAIYAAAHPNASAGQMRQALLASAEPTTSLNGMTATGGRLDLGAGTGDLMFA